MHERLDEQFGKYGGPIGRGGGPTGPEVGGGGGGPIGPVGGGGGGGPTGPQVGAGGGGPTDPEVGGGGGGPTGPEVGGGGGGPTGPEDGGGGGGPGIGGSGSTNPEVSGGGGGPGIGVGGDGLGKDVVNICFCNGLEVEDTDDSKGGVGWTLARIGAEIPLIIITVMRRALARKELKARDDFKCTENKELIPFFPLAARKPEIFSLRTP